jgi:hypothetical protein
MRLLCYNITTDALRYIMITHKELIELLEYDPDSGIFTWKYTRSNRAVKGSIAGTITEDNYISITINSKIYRAHRLAWFYCFQDWPTNSIDHINGIRSDNRLDNLREVTYTQNSYNTRAHIDSATKVKGVYFNKLNNNYRAQIRYNGKTISLGSFKTVEEASTAYNKKAVELHGEFYNTGR